MTTPASGVSSPAMIRSSVDLPEPLGPSSAVSEPSGTSSVTSSSATNVAERLEMCLDVDSHQASFFWGASRVIAISTISDITASSVAAAYAPVMPPGPSVWVALLDQQRQRQRRSRARCEETTATAPISPSARAVVSTTP